MATEIIFNPGKLRKHKHSRRSNPRRRKGVIPPQFAAHVFKKGHNKHRRRKAKNAKSYSFGYNAASAAAVAPISGVQGLLAGYKPGTMIAALPYVAGAFGSAFINRAVAPMLPAVLRSGAGNLALGLGTAGSMAVATNFVSKSWAKGVLLGGVAAVIAQAVSMFDMKKPMFGFAIAGMHGFGGLGSPGARGWVVAEHGSGEMAGMGSSSSGAAVAASGGVSGFAEMDAGDMIEEEESAF